MVTSRRAGLENKHIHLCHVSCRTLSVQEFRDKISELRSEFPLYSFTCPALFGLWFALGLAFESLWWSNIYFLCNSEFFMQLEEMPRVPSAGFMWIYITILLDQLLY